MAVPDGCAVYMDARNSIHTVTGICLYPINVLSAEEEKYSDAAEARHASITCTPLLHPLIHGPSSMQIVAD